jgi:hypothetical protein
MRAIGSPAAFPTAYVRIATPRNTGIIKSKRRIIYRNMLANRQPLEGKIQLHKTDN